jgi:hypothetical protein
LSISTSIDFACPKCKAVSKVLVYRSVNATQDPSVRQLLLDGRLNYFVCAGCDQKGHLLVSLLYHDIARRFLVQYHPYPAVSNESFLREFDRSGRVKLDPSRLPEKPAGPTDYFREMHIVFDMAELVRYVMFREKLFDLHGKTANPAPQRVKPR